MSVIHPAATRVPVWVWGFTPYAVVSVIHVAALAAGATAVSAPTKLWLMPMLAIGVLWAGRGTTWGPAFTLLFVAIALSWLGDGADAFFPSAPELPIMLLCFGFAHLAYMWLFRRYAATRPLPRWTLVYGLWWVVLVAVLWPVLGGLAIGVAVYGLVLGGTATLAARCHPLVAVGGALFLCSDTILAFRLFTPDAMPDWTSPLVMLTYCTGQGLIAAGVCGTARAARARTAER